MDSLPLLQGSDAGQTDSNSKTDSTAFESDFDRDQDLKEKRILREKLSGSITAVCPTNLGHFFYSEYTYGEV